MSERVLSTHRKKRAANFINSLRDPESLESTINCLNDAVRGLTCRACEESGNSEEQSDLITAVCNLIEISDALVYLSTHNLVNLTEPWQEQRK